MKKKKSPVKLLKSSGSPIKMEPKVSPVRSKDWCGFEDPHCYKVDDLTDLDGGVVGSDYTIPNIPL